MYCKYCGKEIGEEQKFCPECGKPADGSAAFDKKRILLFVMAALLAVGLFLVNQKIVCLDYSEAGDLFGSMLMDALNIEFTLPECFGNQMGDSIPLIGYVTSGLLAAAIITVLIIAFANRNKTVVARSAALAAAIWTVGCLALAISRLTYLFGKNESGRMTLYLPNGAGWLLLICMVGVIVCIVLLGKSEKKPKLA